jgi:hypothetical protein
LVKNVIYDISKVLKENGWLEMPFPFSVLKFGYNEQFMPDLDYRAVRVNKLLLSSPGGSLQLCFND